jgi:hypothetical protein
MAVLDNAQHAGKVPLTDRERRTLYLWLDGNAAFYGTYGEAAELAQKQGQQVPMPELQ